MPVLDSITIQLQNNPISSSAYKWYGWARTQAKGEHGKSRGVDGLLTLTKGTKYEAYCCICAFQLLINKLEKKAELAQLGLRVKPENMARMEVRGVRGVGAVGGVG